MKPIQEEIIRNPRQASNSVVQSLIASGNATPDEVFSSVCSLIETTFPTNEEFQAIPSLNHVRLDNIPPMSLVRFRGMVKEMSARDGFACAVFEERNIESGASTLQPCLFQDIIPTQPNVELNLQSERCIWLSRRPLHVVPIPGESAWVTSAFEHASLSALDIAPSPAAAAAAAAASSSGKRSLADSAAMPLPEPEAPSSLPAPLVPAADMPSKSRKVEESAAASSSSDALMSDVQAPSPAMNAASNQGIVAFVHGSECDSIRLCEQYEFVGLIDSAVLPPNDADDFEQTFETSPGLCTLPRIHVISSRKIERLGVAALSCPGTRLIGAPMDMSVARSILISSIAGILGGDVLAAEYTVACLMSRISSRSSAGQILGSFPVNLTKIPLTSPSSTLALCTLLSKIVPCLNAFPLTVETLNQFNFSPKLNADTERMQPGELQLPPESLLVIDESRLQPGTLMQQGIDNLRSLQQLISHQTLKYDFCYHQTDFDTNISILCLSSSPRAIVREMCIVPVASPSSSTPTVDLDEDKLQIMREYLVAARYIEVSLADEAFKSAMESDYVAARQADPTVQQDTLHHWLTLVRLLALSFGEATVSAERWAYMKSLETARGLRLQK